MKVLLSWLREYVDVTVPAAQLAHDLTLRGLELGALETRGDDAVLDLEVTTNRVDCMNVHGVAREVSVIYGLPLKPLALDFPESGPPASEALAVEVQAPDLCPRFCARVLDVRLGPSPAWLRERLEAVGVRPISNLVDLTNYVMMEMGQPSHAFDLARVPNGRLQVRWAKPGEQLTTLDGVERTLGASAGVVAGDTGPLALAGVMGGASSEVTDATQVVALEAAAWEPLAIRRAAKSLAMHTEASHRFERGADPDGAETATRRIAHLLVKIGAGTVRPGLIDVHPRPRQARRLRLRASKAEALLGVSIPVERTRLILSGLGFRLGETQADETPVEVPSWRGDVAREVDLIEEVGRHFGIDQIPATLPEATRAGGLSTAQRAERSIRDFLVGAGLFEVVGYAFVSPQTAGEWVPAGLPLSNPLSVEQSVLRTSVLLPGLPSVLQTNLRQGRSDLRVFELGRTFRDGAPLLEEDKKLAILLTGQRTAPHWSGAPKPTDFFDLKGLVEALADSLGLRELSFQTDGVPGFLHPGQAAVVSASGARWGVLGALHPDVVERFELRGDVYVAELDLDPVLRTVPPARFTQLPRSPRVSRDLSILCAASVSSSDLLGWMRSAAGELLIGIAVADRYDGPPVPAGQVSLTVTMYYQDPARTLTGEEVQESVDGIVRELKARGAEIRGVSDMEDGFELLEEKVKKAAELVRRLRKENKDLEGDLAKIKPRLVDAEKKLQELEKLKGTSAQLETLSQEVKGLRQEREEVKVRIAKLVEVLDTLDA